MEKFGENSSIHGVKYIFGTNNLKGSKLLWALALACSFGGFSFYIYSAYLKWQLDPEIVKRTRERNSSEFPAPAITLCPPLFAKNNSANFYKSHEKNLNKIPLNLSKEECHVLAANIHWCQPVFGPMAEEACDKYNLDDLNVVDVITESSLTVEESFYMCFGGMCDNEIFRIFTIYGICYTQNMMTSSMIFNTENIHEDFLKIVTRFRNESEPLWTPERGYKDETVNFPSRAERDYAMSFVPTLNEVDKENICSFKTFKIIFHNPHEIVTPYHDFVYLNYDELMEFKVFPQAQRTDFALKDFSADSRKCYFEDERKLKFFKIYSKNLCQWECKVNLTLETCGCVKFSMPRDKFTKVCNLTSLKCTVEVDEHSCQCYEACTDVKYSYKMNKTPFNRKFFAPGLPESSVISWIDFEMESETVEEIENFLSYKLQNFISDFGGLLGLFMGCSLLSIIEVFYFIIHGCYELFTRKKTSEIEAEEKKIKQNVNVVIELANLRHNFNLVNEKLNTLNLEMKKMSLDTKNNTRKIYSEPIQITRHHLSDFKPSDSRKGNFEVKRVDQCVLQVEDL